MAVLLVLLSPVELLLRGRAGTAGVVVLLSPAELLLEKGQNDLGEMGSRQLEVTLLSRVSWAAEEPSLEDVKGFLGLKNSLIFTEYLALGEAGVMGGRV